MTQNKSEPEIPNSDAENPHTTAGQKFWFTVKAIEIRLRFIAVLVGIGLVIGYWDWIQNHWDKWTRPAADSVAAPASGEEFYCPMHPSVIRDSLDPGGAIPKCPICGMPLSKRTKGAAVPLAEGVLSRVQLSPYRVQLAGIETAEVAHRPLVIDVRALGVVAVDERKLSRIVVRAMGYVEKLFVNESFTEVRQGQPLAEIYSPEIFTAAGELLIARSGQAANYLESSRKRLELLGLADEEIDEIIRTGKVNPAIVIRAPQSGHVFEKRIVEGDSLQAGQTLFEVADLSTVWIEGELYEKDAVALQTGQTVEVTVDAYPGRVFTGRVSLLHPHVETATRTLRVRCEVDNPQHELRPGMFATLQFKTPIVDTEPFRSELAAYHEWERLASADAPESAERDQSLVALQKICPVTGLKLGSMGKPLRVTEAGRIVFLCCAGCPDKFHARPEYYLARLNKVTDQGVLAVPEQSVIDTGNQTVVYLERDPGVFEGVAVTLGPRAEGYYSVIDGVLAGDRVAAAGAFLVDAETRLNPAASATYFGASGSPESKSNAP
ncbi:MAG: efflux RND transporter periplasmic adaptor subunit [Pirellulales bacterium]